MAEIEQVRSALAEVVRDRSGELLSGLAEYSGSMADAEDALQDACLKALSSWSDRGIPDNPAGWLFVSAKRRCLRLAGQSQRRARREVSFETLRERELRA